MNPEELISAFLSVWQKSPELFNNPEVSDSLGDLQNQLIELETASDQQIADCLENWFANYEAITDAVDAASTRKLSGGDKVLTTKTGDHVVKSLTDTVQIQVISHLRDYLADLQDEQRWDTAFNRTQSALVTAARQAKQQRAVGQAVPMDYNQL